jgi:hypothetical protein
MAGDGQTRVQECFRVTVSDLTRGSVMSRKRIAATVHCFRHRFMVIVTHLFVAQLCRTRRRAVSVLVSLVGLATLTLTGAASPPPMPMPTPTSSATSNSGTEGSKAALVRIDLLAIAEIAHIDHSSGEVVISRGRSTVPLGSATGVVVSADGIVATTMENLTLDESAVAVYSANELFANVLKVPIVGNGGNPLRRGTTPDPYWAPHLQHCYEQVEHCIVFRAPQYRVHTYTTKPATIMAELMNHPSGPKDIALLRIGGGGGAPTATLATTSGASSANPAADPTPGSGPVLVGFTTDPTLKDGPAEFPVAVDTATGRISSSQDLAAPLEAGVSGAPVLDKASGQVLGLMGPRTPDAQGTLVSAASIQAAMAAAGVQASPSKFDAVFRRGIDHLSSGMGGSAVSALEESLTYFDSALASSHLEQAQKMSNEQPTGDQGAAAANAGKDGPLPAALLPGLVGVVLVTGLLTMLTLRRRRAPAPRGAASSATRHADRSNSKAANWTPSALLKLKRNTSDSGTAMTRAAGPQDDKVPMPQSGPGTGPGQGKSTEHKGFPSPHAPQLSRRADDGSPAGREEDAGPDLDVDETRAAGPLAPRSAQGQGRVFCSQCGSSVRPSGRFCSSCGYPVG